MLYRTASSLSRTPYNELCLKSAPQSPLSAGMQSYLPTTAARGALHWKPNLNPISNMMPISA